MISVDRARVPVPEALDGPNSRAARELGRARTAFGPGGDEDFTFRAYKDDSVKRALYDLFGGKCAYCETFYAASQPMDVEHFRPKGGFIENERLEQPGYWWLAADWSNLLPSCIDCNRKRQHGEGDDAKDYGKENLFPVRGARARAEGDDLEAEESLLIDPCRDDPSLFFVYAANGVILRKPRLHQRRRLMAEASMEVYGLVRPGLTKLRRDQQLSIFGQIKAAVEPFRAFRANSADPAARERLADVLRDLLHLRSRAVAYTAMGRFFIDSKLVPIRRGIEQRLAAELPEAPGDDPDVLVRFVEAFAPAGGVPGDDLFED